MFYKFSSAAGRLVKSGQLQAYVPQGLRAGTGGESAGIIYASGTHFKPIQNFTQKPASAGNCGEVPEHIKKFQRKFQIDDGVPVHLKNGTKDKVLFGLTVLLALYGLEECLRLYYTLAFPKKPE